MELRKLCCHTYMLEGVESALEPADAAEGLRYFLYLWNHVSSSLK